VPGCGLPVLPVMNRPAYIIANMPALNRGGCYSGRQAGRWAPSPLAGGS
jgi:hypothetical protein